MGISTILFADFVMLVLDVNDGSKTMGSLHQDLRQFGGKQALGVVTLPATLFWTCQIVSEKSFKYKASRALDLIMTGSQFDP